MSRDGESHSLVIKNVTEEDKGEYRIEAGPAKSTASLEVKGESRKSPKQARENPSAPKSRRSSPKTGIKEENKTAPPKRSVSKEGKMSTNNFKNMHMFLGHQHHLFHFQR